MLTDIVRLDVEEVTQVSFHLDDDFSDECWEMSARINIHANRRAKIQMDSQFILAQSV